MSVLGVCSPACLKRRGSDSEDEIAAKSARYSYYVTLEDESPLPTSEDDESIYTVQGNETEFVKDTSDTSTHSWDSNSDDDISVRLEFEVASHSEEENPMLNPTSSSDPEDIVTMGVIAAIYNETDIGFADDSDDSRSTVDSEIGKADYWTCVQCTNKNNNPLFRYCEKCYQIRKNFFPPRPKRKKRRQQTEKVTVALMQRTLPEVLSGHDSGIGSQDTKSSQELDESKNLESLKSNEGVDTVDSSEKVLNEEIKINKTEDNGSIIVGCSTEIQTIVDAADTENKKNDTDSDNMCVMCTLYPKNGAFSHGSTLHVCCCYKCAVRIWRTNKHCPICNRKITNVQKVFYN